MKALLSVTFFTALLTALRMLAGFVTAKVVAIYAGPSGIAMVGQLQNLVNGLAGLMNSPVGSSVVRFTAENHEDGYQSCAPWWRVSLRGVICLSLLIMPVIGFFSSEVSIWLFDDAKYRWLVMVTVFTLPFTAVGTLVTSVINGQQKYKQFVCLGTVSVLISSSVMLFLVISKGLVGALLAAAIQNGLIGIAILLFALRQPWFKIEYWFGAVDKYRVKVISGYILMAVASAITMPMAMIYIRKILVAYVGWEVTGYWQSVWKISEAYLAIVTLSLSTYYFPQLSKLHTYAEIKKEINSTAKIIMPIVFFMAVGIYLFRDIAISLLFTEKFRAARDLFAIQLTGDVIKIFSWLYAYPMLSRGAVKWFVPSEIFFAISLTLLCWLFVKSYGVQGANIAYCVNYILYFLFVIFNIKKFAR